MQKILDERIRRKKDLKTYIAQSTNKVNGQRKSAQPIDQYEHLYPGPHY